MKVNIKDNKWLKVIITFLAVMLLILFVISLSPREMQNDTFWSIKVGENIFNNGIIKADSFSIHEGLMYVAQHFLTDVGIYLVYTLGGFELLYVTEVVLAVILAALLYILNYEVSNNRLASYIFVFIQMILLSGYIAVRAQMVSFILFALEILLLEKYMKKLSNKYLVGIGVIPILLANFHMGVIPFYFIILGVYILGSFKFNFMRFTASGKIDKVRLKQLLLVGVVGLITVFINPYFIDGVTYAFKTIGNTFINSYIAEFQPLALNSSFAILTLLYAFVVLLTFILNNKKINLKDFLLIIGTLFMSFLAIRYISLFVICSAVILKYLVSILDQYDYNTNDKLALNATCIIVMTIVAMLFTGEYAVNKRNNAFIPDTAYPIKAVQYIKENKLEEARIFNEYSWGSYLMLNNIKPYIDSRCDLYTKEYSNVDIAEDYGKIIECDIEYKEILQKYDIDVILIPTKAKFVTVLKADGEYEMIYEDETAIIAKKK